MKAYLLEEVCCEHQNLGIWAKALDCTEIANTLLVVLGGGHNLEDMEGGPGHVMAEHFQVYQLQQGSSLQV